MSEHKTGRSNLTKEEKELYWKRRSMGLPGLIGYANIGHTVDGHWIPDRFKKPRKSKAYLSKRGTGR